MKILVDSPTFSVIPNIWVENPEMTPEMATIIAMINTNPIIDRNECFLLLPIIRIINVTNNNQTP